MSDVERMSVDDDATVGGKRVRPVSELSRDELAVLVREYLLGGQLIDRAGMPHIISAFGRDVMGEIAIEEWMGASPIYTPRIQQLLGFVGDDVETIFKGMQFDIGAPPEFMDFRYNVISPDHGEFWLDHCGALMDVEPLGDDYVFTMCHTIEDPTFDATAIATNRRARMSAIHRPPREPADRQPHCHWEVRIDPDAEPLPDPDALIEMRSSVLASLPLTSLPLTSLPSASIDSGGEGDWSDYSAPLDPDLRLEQFAKGLLLALVEEVGVQYHLLVMSMCRALERRVDTEKATEIVGKQFIGIAGLIAERLCKAFGLGDDLTAFAQVLDLHPAFRPRAYVDLFVRSDLDSVVVELRDCPALGESGVDSWITLMGSGDRRALDAIAHAVNPRIRIEEGDMPRTWRAVIDRDAQPSGEATEVTLTKYSTGASFEFSESPVEVPQRR